MSDPPPSELRADARCEGCGAVVAGGTAGCQAIFEEMQIRSYQDPRYAHQLRLRVDAYALQHPDRYCVSAKSFAAHLTGVCAALEHSSADSINAAIVRWLSRNPPIRKPQLPPMRGVATITDVAAASPDGHGAAVLAWADSAWGAYVPFQALARHWIQEAMRLG